MRGLEQHLTLIVDDLEEFLPDLARHIAESGPVIVGEVGHAPHIVALVITASDCGGGNPPGMYWNFPTPDMAAPAGELGPRPDMTDPCAGCVEPRMCCDGACVDIFSDAKHCGSCAKTCTPAEMCNNKQCFCPAGGGVGAMLCLPSETCCPGAGCTDIKRNQKHCGACGSACGSGAMCQNGGCACGFGSVCAPGQACQAGVCSGGSKCGSLLPITCPVGKKCACSDPFGLVCECQ